MGRPRSVLAAVLLSLGCAPASPTDPAPVPTLVDAPVPTPVDAPTDPGPADEPEIDPADVEPAPVVADSDIQTGFHVDPNAAPGLLAFVAELPQQGSLWVGKLDGNGGRDVVVFIPPGADNAAPFELVFHFHGTYSETFVKPADDKPKREWVGWDRLAQTIEAITELQSKQPYNVALVYPFSAGKRLEPGHRGWSNVAYDRMWMDGVAPPTYADDFAKLHAESVAILQDTFGVHASKLPLSEGVIAEGHSAGGIALLNIALHGSPHVREYIFLDASFQSWADGCHAAVKQSGAPAKITLVVTKKGIADPFDGRDPWCVDMQADAELWPTKQSWCAKQSPDKDVPGSDWTCAELEERAQAWTDDYADWCAAYKDGMRSIPEVQLVETKIVHAKQPRHFAGGLELAADRWD